MLSSDYLLPKEFLGILYEQIERISRCSDLEAAGIEPAALRSVQRRKLFYTKDLTSFSRVHRYFMQRICSVFAATERYANVPLL